MFRLICKTAAKYTKILRAKFLLIENVEDIGKNFIKIF